MLGSLRVKQANRQHILNKGARVRDAQTNDRATSENKQDTARFTVQTHACDTGAQKCP